MLLQIVHVAVPQVALHSVFTELCKLMSDHLSKLARESKADSKQFRAFRCAMHLCPV